MKKYMLDMKVTENCSLHKNYCLLKLTSDQILPELLFRPYYSESNFCKGLLFSDNRHILLCFRFHSEPYRENRPVY